MSASSRIDAAPLSVLLDVRHPQAYLAFHPAAELGRELSLEINWLPVVVSPLKRPAPPRPDDDRGTRHRRHRAEATAREIEVYARARGLALRDYYRDPDPAILNLGWLWVRDRRPERMEAYLDAAFRRYWAGELDLEKEGEIAALVEAVGAGREAFSAFCAGDGRAVAAGLADELRERGAFATPGYFARGEYFWGRQHLPMIRWILGGRVGPGPI